jgi:hypothetical protein
MRDASPGAFPLFLARIDRAACFRATYDSLRVAWQFDGRMLGD